jgi:hypothetical protein
VCSPNPCPQPSGACCFPDGSCTYVLDADCAGDWQGYGSVCAPNPCPQPPGACCFPDGSCQVLSMLECQTQGGQYVDIRDCIPGLCPQPVGACCLADGSCIMLPEADCLGTWLGPGTACGVDPCPPPGP